MYDFVEINKEGYTVMLENDLEINYDDVVWPSNSICDFSKKKIHNERSIRTNENT